MADYWIWWILAAVLIGTELLTGTFYLLAVGVAFVLGGVAAWLGGSLPVQLLIGGVFAVVGTIAAHQWRKLHAMPTPAGGTRCRAGGRRRWPGATTARRASSTAARNGMPNSRRPG